MQLNETLRLRRFAATGLGAASAALVLTVSAPVTADVSEETLRSLSAPSSVETQIGTLEFSDGVPSRHTARTVFDTIDFTRALNVYNNSFRGASALALKRVSRASGRTTTTSSSSRS
jgi:hypothetical protein